jgi:cytidylate kinase
VDKQLTKYVIRTESDRTAFIRKYYHADISNPAHYDLIVDTSRVGIDGTVKTVKRAFHTWEAAGFQR